jgi:hypothetical protein
MIYGKQWKIYLQLYANYVIRRINMAKIQTLHNFP